MRQRDLPPADRRRYANPETRRRCPAAQASFDCGNNTITQILRQCSGHPCRPPYPARILNQNFHAEGIFRDSGAVENALDRQLQGLGRVVLTSGGAVSKADADRHAEREYKIYDDRRKAERRLKADQLVSALREQDKALPKGRKRPKDQ